MFCSFPGYGDALLPRPLRPSWRSLWGLVHPTIKPSNTVYKPDAPLVLVVDEDAATREVLRRGLETEGYRVVEASQAQQAINTYLYREPDLVLLHAFLPIVDGFTCCEQLQALTVDDRCPILMLSPVENAELIERAFEVGATDIVTKPVNWSILRQRVRRLIEESQLQKELEAANRELQRLICVDSLTQVASRHYFDEILQEELQWRRQHQTPLSLIMCDVDYFKRYNDTYGHQAGDKCLQEIARAISDAVGYQLGGYNLFSLPSYDDKQPRNVVARYGGEEFAAILPGVDAAGAVSAAKQIRDRLHALKIPHAGSEISPYVTLSLGVACVLPGDDCSAERLIYAADRGLYRAKEMGRDRLISSSEF